MSSQNSQMSGYFHFKINCYIVLNNVYFYFLDSCIIIVHILFIIKKIKKNIFLLSGHNHQRKVDLKA